MPVIPNVNPFAYTNRTYNTIYNELKLVYPNKPDWFLRIISGRSDIAHWYLDAAAQNLVLSTSYTSEAARDLMAYLDYYPQNKAPAGGNLLVTVGVTPLSIPKENLIFSISTPDGDVIRYEATEDLNVSAPDLTATIPVLQGETKTDISLGTSDGITSWQELVVPDTDVILTPFGARPAFQVTVNSVVWDLQENLVNSSALETHFRWLTKPDDITALLFGNGSFGLIPPPTFPVLATYRVGGGILGRVLSAGAVTAYIGTSSDVVSASMVADFTGGSDGELLSASKRLAPQMLRANYRAVTENDQETLSEAYSPSVIKAKSLPGLYGAGTVGIHIIPAGGGAPSNALKTALQTYLIDRSSICNADTRVRDPLYQTEPVVAAIKMRGGSSFATFKPYAELVCYLLTSEVSQEIIDIFDEEGIASAITFMNTKWAFTFTTSDQNELSAIIRRRKRDGAVQWGGDLRPNDIIAALDDLTGVEFPTVTTPATIISVSFNRVMTDGTATITEIT